MPITQTLEAHGRILRIVLADPWTVEEMLAAFKETEHYLDAAAKPIHLLVDMKSTVRTAPGAIRAREAPVLRHPMSGEIAIFGANLAGRILAEAVLKLARFQRALLSNRVRSASLSQRADRPRSKRLAQRAGDRESLVNAHAVSRPIERSRRAACHTALWQRHRSPSVARLSRWHEWRVAARIARAEDHQHFGAGGCRQMPHAAIVADVERGAGGGRRCLGQREAL